MIGLIELTAGLDQHLHDLRAVSVPGINSTAKRRQPNRRETRTKQKKRKGPRSAIWHRHTTFTLTTKQGTHQSRNVLLNSSCFFCFSEFILHNLFHHMYGAISNTTGHHISFLCISATYSTTFVPTSFGKMRRYRLRQSSNVAMASRNPGHDSLYRVNAEVLHRGKSLCGVQVS